MSRIKRRNIDRIDLYDFVDKYEVLYQKCVVLFDKHNPCQVLDGTCIRERRGLGDNFCCRDCKYLSPSGSGCTVKSLWCKIWLCDYLLLSELCESFENDVTILQSEIRKLECYPGRYSLPDNISHRYGQKVRKRWEKNKTLRRR